MKPVPQFSDTGLCLTTAELVDLTGYRRPSKQAEQLREWGIHHFVARDGHPRVLRSVLEGGERARAAAPRPGPRLEGLGGRRG